jgi:hypothetical protein
MMPCKMAEYHRPFNHVTQDYISYLRGHRTGDMFRDIAGLLDRWSVECKYACEWLYNYPTSSGTLKDTLLLDVCIIL